MCSQTREACSKVGRDLLVSVANAHPFILSLLIQGTKDNMENIGSVRHRFYINMERNFVLEKTETRFINEIYMKLKFF